MGLDRISGRWPPYGSYVDADGTLRDHPGEQAVIVAARELRAAGLSVAEIVYELDLRGLIVPPQGGGRFIGRSDVRAALAKRRGAT